MHSPLGPFPPVGPFLEGDFPRVNISQPDNIKGLLLDLVFGSSDHTGDDFKWGL